MRYKWVLIWVGLTVSLGLLVWVFWNLDWSAFIASIVAVNAGWAAAALVAVAVSIAVRAMRWNAAAGRPLRDYARFWQSTVIGLTGNAILPLRAGEVLRIAVLVKRTGALVSVATTSAVLDRTSDVTALAGLVLVVAGIHTAGVVGTGVWAAAAAIIVLVFAVLGGVARWGDAIARTAEHVALWLPADRNKSIAVGTARGLATARAFMSPRRFLAVAGLTVTAFAIDVTVFWLVIVAFGWSLPFEAALTTAVFIMVGFALPSAPAYIGVYQAACVLALGLYGIDMSAATAYSVVVQTLQVGTITTQGAIAAYLSGVGLFAKAKGQTSAEGGLKDSAR